MLCTLGVDAEAGELIEVPEERRGRIWLIDRELEWMGSKGVGHCLMPYCPDEYLMPIRPSREGEAVREAVCDEAGCRVVEA